MTDEQIKAYIAGFMDGEGHIGCHKAGKGHWMRSIAFSNTDKALVDFMSNALHQVGFATREQFDEAAKPNWSPRWTVYVAGGRKSFDKFRELIPLQAPAKRKALDLLLSNYSLTRGKPKVGIITPCEVCGKPTYVSNSFRRRGGGRFCSVACRGLSQRTRKAVVCQQCGKPFDATPTRQKVGGKFCSHSCSGKSQAARMRGMASVAATTRWHTRD